MTDPGYGRGMWWLLACTGDPVDVPGGGTGCDPAADLAAAEAATEGYADEQAALDAGYVPQPDCEADPYEGAMGIHYVRVGDSLDQELDVESPDVLLYVPDGDGVRLVGVEYARPALIGGEFVFGAPADLAEFDPAPTLFCRTLDGPMAGHVPGQPWHYDLHVWLFADNPSGMFAQYDPDEDCTP
jgi:hypothetical protein